MLDQFNYKDALEVTEFRQLTLLQLKKDLERVQCDFNIDGENFVNDLANILEKLPEEKLAQLLYLIDIPENNHEIENTANIYLSIAEQIIHREALKVFWRKRFSAT